MGLSSVAKFFIKLAISLYSYNQQRKAQKKAERQARAARSNVLINKQSNNDPVYILYGRQRMGGTRVYVDTSNGSGDLAGTTKLNFVLVMCEGEINTVKQVYFNDTIVWDDADGGTLSANSSGGYTLGGWISKYAPTITSNWYPGTATQTVDTSLQASVGSSVWTNAHKLQGVSYFTMLLEADGEKYGGQLPVVTFVLEGKTILDVSTLVDGDVIGDMTSANYTSGQNQSPVDVMYDYLINTVFGKGLDRDANGTWIAGRHIDLASFQQARLDAAAARSGAGYKINGFLQTEKQLFDNVGEILETCNGILLFKDGKYQMRIKKPNEQVGISSSAIFDKDTIIGTIELSLPDKARKLNKATGIFNNPDTKYNDDVIIFDDAAFRVTDNGSVLETQEDYTMITDSAQVLDLITQTVNISRDEYTIRFTAAHTALLLRSGDIIEVRHPEFGWGVDAGEQQIFFRVQELKLTEDNTVEITATKYDSSKEL